MKALVFSFLFFLNAASDAKTFSSCELATNLKHLNLGGFHGYSLENWVCMAYHESRYNSRAVGPPNWDGSRDYGIFQINSRWWCNNNEGKTANGCGKPCSAFIDDDITDDIACAKKIVQDSKGMYAWAGWVNNCKGNNLSKYVRGCNL